MRKPATKETSAAAHSQRLISAFVFSFLDGIIFVVVLSKISRLAVTVAELASLGLTRMIIPSSHGGSSSWSLLTDFSLHMILVSLNMLVTDIFDRLTMFLPVSDTLLGSVAFRIKRRHCFAPYKATVLPRIHEIDINFRKMKN